MFIDNIYRFVQAEASFYLAGAYAFRRISAYLAEEMGQLQKGLLPQKVDHYQFRQSILLMI